ncbi:MAG: hypothetical protein K6B71_03635 [Alphaproteobacteria bacterium]|nr:hypothetical protein [Alphaproteobacteria bacterium]
MKRDIINFLIKCFPFLLTILLLRLSAPWFNPAGILAIIPVFYCSFIRPVPYFTFFAILICFLIDYKFGTVFTWTIFYCLYYAVANIQTFIDLTHTDKHGFYAFMIFIGVIILTILLAGLTFLNFLMSGLLFLYVCAMYIPITMIINKVVKND